MLNEQNTIENYVVNLLRGLAAHLDVKSSPLN
jgi:hypothetical protein